MTPRAKSQSPAAKARTLTLERFAWAAPDRLELAGTFTGLADPPAELPVLVLAGAERTYRLPAAADDVSGAPENGRPWRAAFVWEEPPAAFDGAVLTLGGDLAVDLPEPGANGDRAGGAQLPVRSQPGAERVRLETELLVAREELQEVQSALQRTEEELSRARADLQAEREGRAADALRFRDGLARVRASAEDALAAERHTAEQLRGELAAAADAAAVRDAELADVRGELEVATAFRAEAERRIEAARAALAE
jgi:hypothetical protein